MTPLDLLRRYPWTAFWVGYVLYVALLVEVTR